jgi:hypothetical protein
MEKTMSELFWHPDDKQWMKERKEKWRAVKQSLDVISHGYTPFKRKYHKYHKELFFTGVVNDEAKNVFAGVEYSTGNEAFDHVLPLFEVWYHPQVEKLDISQLLLSYIKRGTMNKIREAFFQNFFRTSCDNALKLFSPAEGMMNGRETQVVKLVCPGYDFKELVSDTINPNQAYGQSVCAHPKIIETYLKSGTRIELTSDARFIPYAPGQYLWDHLSFALEQYPDKVFDPSSTNKTYDELKRQLLELIALILTFEKRTDKSRHRPSTIAMVERLIGKYENKSFSDAMLKLWEEAKQNLNDLLEKCSFSICRSPEDLEKYDYMPIDFQNERMSQWKQV